MALPSVGVLAPAFLGEQRPSTSSRELHKLFLHGPPLSRAQTGPPSSCRPSAATAGAACVHPASPPPAAGWLFTYYNSKKTDERKAQIERINAQVGQLYGPLLACVHASRSAYAAMVRQHSPDGTVQGFVQALQAHPEGPEGESYRCVSVPGLLACFPPVHAAQAPTLVPCVLWQVPRHRPL